MAQSRRGALELCLAMLAVAALVHTASSQTSNPCATNPCGNPALNHTCIVINTTTSTSDAITLTYACRCASGYYVRNQTCTRDNCTTVNCGRNGNCTLTSSGQARCVCNQGWASPNTTSPCSVCATGYTLNTTSGRCVDVNECMRLISPCGRGVKTCTNTIGSYRCTCLPGYTVSSDLKRCIDIDECKTLARPCFNATSCLNTAGNYLCVCPAGYTQKIVNGVRYCVDINECQVYNGTVCKYGSCTNTPRSYSCSCPSGFVRGTTNVIIGGVVRNITVCKDINECASTWLNLCSTIAGNKCINGIGNYTCNCTVPGYTFGINAQNKAVCQWDPCTYYFGKSSSSQICGGKGKCINLPKANATYPLGYGCLCDNFPLYSPYGLGTNNLTCIYNICYAGGPGFQPCNPGGCTPVPYGCKYQCKCPDGYYQISSATQCPTCIKLVVGVP